MNTSPGSSKVMVTLVHGTWGKLKLPFSGSLWFEQGSEFALKIKEQIETYGIQASVAPFVWSGANSIVHRAEASELLARYLSRQKMNNPGVTQVLVAHSHGGTVCLMALKRLASDVNPIVITLATPFMEIINSEAMPSAERLKAA